MGCANYHARIRFPEAGTTWLIRVPRMNNGLPQSLIGLPRSQRICHSKVS